MLGYLSHLSHYHVVPADLLGGDAQQPAQLRDAGSRCGTSVKYGSIEIKYGELAVKLRGTPGIVSVILPQRIGIVEHGVVLVEHCLVLIKQRVARFSPFAPECSTAVKAGALMVKGSVTGPVDALHL